MQVPVCQPAIVARIRSVALLTVADTEASLQMFGFSFETCNEEAIAMAGQYSDLFTALAAPFDAAEVKVRSQGGRQLQYVTARTVMNRLDEVLGPENWWDSYTLQGQGILCSLSIRLPDGSILTKQDAGGFAGMTSEEDNEKSGYSDAFKRGAVKFGVARYLYRDGVPHLEGAAQEVEPEVPTRWDPSHAVDRDQQRQGPRPPRREHDQPDDVGRPPMTGRELFAMAKKAEERLGTKILSSIIAAAKELGISGRTIDWTPSQIAKVWPIAEKLISLPTPPSS